VVEVRFHPEAQAEYQEALAWYLASSSRAAARFEAEVDRVVGLVADKPATFPTYDDEHRYCMLRRFPFGLVYRATPNLVEIIAVAHLRRSAGYWRGRT